MIDRNEKLVELHYKLHCCNASRWFLEMWPPGEGDRSATAAVTRPTVEGCKLRAADILREIKELEAENRNEVSGSHGASTGD